MNRAGNKRGAVSPPPPPAGMRLAKGPVGIGLMCRRTDSPKSQGLITMVFLGNAEVDLKFKTSISKRWKTK